MSTPVKLMTIGDVCRYTQKSREKIELYLRCPEKAPVPFPAPVVVQGKERWWDRKDVKHWLDCYTQYRSIVNLRVRGNTRVLQELKSRSQKPGMALRE
ncbi:hypothetical protein [Burkholderia phage FLC9]|nr:hypothetical protein [Burkholderia phage FLC9]